MTIRYYYEWSRLKQLDLYMALTLQVSQLCSFWPPHFFSGFHPYFFFSCDCLLVLFSIFYSVSHWDNIIYVVSQVYCLIDMTMYCCLSGDKLIRLFIVLQDHTLSHPGIHVFYDLPTTLYTLYMKEIS